MFYMKNGSLNVNKWDIRKAKTENIYCEIHGRKNGVIWKGVYMKKMKRFCRKS